MSEDAVQVKEDSFQTSEDSAYTVKLDMFEGPLDLLLHLIHKNELEIANIPIALITEQYLEYIQVMKDLNLDVAGEYLLMASTLLHIKSKMLLPSSRNEEEEEGGEDPREELIRRLLEYEKYKKAAQELEGRPVLDRNVFIRLAPAEAEKEETGEGEKIEANLFELLEAFRKVLERAKPEFFHEVILDRLTVEEKVQEIISLLRKENRSIAFHLLFSDKASRREIVVTFLAILELVKTRQVRIFQPTLFETIHISPALKMEA
jgi:segregation and condensation protein A